MQVSEMRSSVDPKNKSANTMSQMQNVQMEEIAFGYCQCGCGQKTNIAIRNELRRGHIKGEPMRYVQGHGHHGLQPFCRRGHARTPENLYSTGACRICHADKHAKQPLITIYAILDPITFQVRYVGQTTKKVEVRMLWHAKKESMHQLKRHDGHFYVIELEHVTEEIRDAKEQSWIEYFRCLGMDLLNISSGGAGTQGRKWTESQREKFINSRKRG